MAPNIPDPVTDFAPIADALDGLKGLMAPDDQLDAELRAIDDEALQPF
jgi:hypothetical protein